MQEDINPTNGPFGPAVLPAGIRSRLVPGINGLTMHVLEAGHDTSGTGARPCVLLLHGFPELAYSWRKIMMPLAAAGYHVVAPDQRGYGRTTGWDPAYDGDLHSYRIVNLVRDAIGLVAALGLRSVHAVVGHDFGSFVAAWCALLRPDVFRSMVLMSAPFAGPPALPFDTARGTDAPADGAAADRAAADRTAEDGVAEDGASADRAAAGGARKPVDIHQALAALPRPRKHYQWYYSSREAADDMRHAPQGLHAFLRAYYHHKSADWKQNKPFELASWTAEELQRLPTYYVMDEPMGMAETVAREMPSAAEIAANSWLTDEELAVYSGEFGRTGFQGALQWYRCMTDPRFAAELQLWSGCTIDVPSCFIAGSSDWGIHQRPGDLERMRTQACTRMSAVHLVDGAGHWVQQEQPAEVEKLLLAFLKESG
jgi:pimeloyl-ACP methyl ester carboxylesterase